jgi:hypothetical protein
LNIRKLGTMCRKWGRISRAPILALAVLTALATASPALAEMSGWIPWEDEEEIARRQYPERFPVPFLLPDLRTLPPSDIDLLVDEGNGQKSLRFSNSVWNAGPGVLELRGDLDPQTETVRAVQIVYREDGTYLERPAGEFEYHSVHQHVHWDAFALYEVWSTLPDGSLGQMHASSDKVGYCIRDIAPYDAAKDEEQLELVTSLKQQIPTQPGYTSCSWRRQGMSVGWYDIYRSYTSGQSVDISHLPDGIYALHSIADPTKILREADESNNSAVIYFSLQDEQISVFEKFNERSQP